MGEIRKITCQSCGRNWELQTGSGLRHGLLENVISAFPENLRKKIAGSMEDMEFPIYDFAYQPAHCEETGPICGRRVKLMKSMKRNACPVCGEKALLEEETGMWD